jgi:tight adherence protein B
MSGFNLPALLPFLLPPLAAAAVYFLITAFFGGDPVKKIVRKRLSALAARTDLEAIHDDVMKEKRKSGKHSKKQSKLISKRFEDSLVTSGIKLTGREYLFAWIGTTTLPVAILAVLGKSFISVLGAGIVGFIIPPFLVHRARKKRQQLFNMQLSEALIVMGNCIKSGYSFQQAMESVAKDMQPPISGEFSAVLREMRFGVAMEEALGHMVERTGSPDIGLLVSAVVASSQVGANLSDILDNISATIKDRIKIRDEVRVLTAQGRMSGLIIGLLPVVIALMLMLMNPDFIMAFFESTLGKILLAVGAFLEVIGFFAVKKVVDIKY